MLLSVFLQPINLLIQLLSSTTIPAPVVPVSSGTSTVLVSVLGGVAGAAVITVLGNIYLNRGSRRIAERTDARDDKTLELASAKQDVENANANAASALALATETRNTLSGLIDNLRKQTESQHTAIEGLNATIAGLTSTVQVLEKSQTASGELVAEQRTFIADLVKSRDQYIRDLAAAESTIAEKTVELANLEAEKVEWTQENLKKTGTRY